jgi:hypothetical protein
LLTGRDVTPSGYHGVSGAEEIFERSAGMPSTVIRRFDYSPERQELVIEFVTGRRYLYSAVPVEAAEALRGAFSKGTHFNRHIRDHYPYRELV